MTVTVTVTKTVTTTETVVEAETVTETVAFGREFVSRVKGQVRQHLAGIVDEGDSPESIGL